MSKVASQHGNLKLPMTNFKAQGLLTLQSILKTCFLIDVGYAVTFVFLYTLAILGTWRQTFEIHKEQSDKTSRVVNYDISTELTSNDKSAVYISLGNNIAQFLLCVLLLFAIRIRSTRLCRVWIFLRTICLTLTLTVCPYTINGLPAPLLVFVLLQVVAQFWFVGAYVTEIERISCSPCPA